MELSARLDNANALLEPGMSGNAKIGCGRRPIIDLVIRRFVRHPRVEFRSW